MKQKLDMTPQEADGTSSGGALNVVMATSAMSRDELAREVELLRKRLQEAEERLLRHAALQGAPENRRILEAVPSGVIRVGSLGDILYANAEAQRILGLDYDNRQDRYTARDEGLHAVWEDGSPCPVNDYPVIRCLSTGLPQAPTVIGLRGSSGETRWALFTAIPTEPDIQNQCGAVVTVIDVTDRQLAREQQRRFAEQLRHAQKMESLGRLAGGIAHDMNNILATIMGVTSALRLENDADELLTGDLDIILTSCRRGRELIQNLLGFARKGRLRPQRVDLNQLVKEVERMFSRTVEPRVALRVSLTGQPLFVKVDPSQISHALMNLCINSSDAIQGPGSISMTTGTFVADASQSQLVEGISYAFISVHDTGVGMPPAVAKQAFDPFFTTKPQGKGTGLGLSMVYGTLRNHGGDAHLETEPGQGTTITLYLPLELAEEPEDSPVPSALASSSPAPADKTILIIDDESSVLRAHWMLLRQLGYTVLIAASLTSARETFMRRADAIDMLMLDASMPEGDWMHFMSDLRGLRPEVRVFLLADRIDEELEARARQANIQALLTKPLESDVLAPLLLKHLHHTDSRA